MKICDKQVDVAARAVRFTFANGKALVCRFDELSDEMKLTSALYGINHSVGDSYASAAKQVNPAQWAYETACAKWHNIVSGEWISREGTGGILAEALARVSGKPLEACAAAIKGLDDKAKRKLERNAKIELAIAETRAERAKAKLADSDDDDIASVIP